MKTSQNREKKTSADETSNIHLEWERLKHLIPEVENNNEKSKSIKDDILKLIDGKNTCEDVVKSQGILSENGAIFMLLKYERDGVIGCIRPLEKFEKILFEKSTAEKHLEQICLERDRLLQKVAEKREQFQNDGNRCKDLENEAFSLKEKIRIASENTDKLHKKHKEVLDSLNYIVGDDAYRKKRKEDVEKAIHMIKAEIGFLSDERASAMERIKELENKIEDVINQNDAVLPKINIYRSVVRGAYKTLREIQTRSEYAIK